VRVVYGATRSPAVVAFQYEGSGDTTFDDYMSSAVVDWSYGPEFPIGPSRTYKPAVEGNYYFAPEQAGTTAGTRYLLEFTPAEWAEQFTELAFDGTQPPPF
jgi:hypothetical protein